MLDVHALSRSYGDFKAVQDINFNIKTGEIVGLLGYNGAGKTTIMRMISGFLEPDSGQVLIDGVCLQDDPQQAKSNIGYLPENLPIYPELSVIDYLDYVADLKQLQGEKSTQIAEVIQATALADHVYQSIGLLSRGYKQRVGVAQALLGHPKILILDEPTNGLDPQQTHDMRLLIQRLSQHSTIILSTHIMQEVSAICTRVLMIRSGQLIFDRQMGSLQKNHQIEVRTNLPVNQADGFKTLDSIDVVEQLPQKDKNYFQYQLILNENANVDDALSEVSEFIHKKQYQLNLLRPIQQSIESLFI